MIKRLYVHNFRCFENFSIDFEGLSSALVIGKNGAGKSTLREVLKIFQRISRGSHHVRDLIQRSDFTRGRTDLPMRFEIELLLEQKQIQYVLSFEFPKNLREARVEEEKLVVDSEVVFSRDKGEVSMGGGSTFVIDWHMVGLPVVQDRQKDWTKSLNAFFSSMVLVSPLPTFMSGFSESESTELEEDASNLSSALSSLLSLHPGAYNDILVYLKNLLPDLSSFYFTLRGEKGKQLLVKFESESSETFDIEFRSLSSGEKCFFLSAFLLASSKHTKNFFCMWDEPDHHLALPEVGHFILELRKVLGHFGQLFATSHHPETIRKFSDENTLVFHRRSHLEPTTTRKLKELSYKGDLIEALIHDWLV